MNSLKGHRLILVW